LKVFRSTPNSFVLHRTTIFPSHLFAGPLGYEIDPQAPEGRAWRALVRAEFIEASNRAFRRAQLWFALKKPG
jgi:hypothetical protein